MTINGAWQEEVYPEIYNHLSWKWYAELTVKTNRVYIADFGITVIFPEKQRCPMVIVDGKYKSKTIYSQMNYIYRQLEIDRMDVIL